MDPRHEVNRKRWDEVTPVHVRSEFYDVPGFLAGRNTLFDIEREALGDVRGKSLLHLQCHFGLDSLNWARLGADVVGVDFSEAAIREARDLAEKAGLSKQCRFVCSDVLELEQHLDGAFDIVFTSYGVITWLADLKKWARTIARFLKPDGRFFMAEIHPFSYVFHDERPGEIAYDYFSTEQGVVLPVSPDYADSSFVPTQPETYWPWTFADIFGSLREAGLTIEDFREFPFTCYQQFPYLIRQANGQYVQPEGKPRIPLLFSLSATKKN